MNPAAVIPKQATVFSSSTPDLSDVKQLLQRQLQIAGSLQEVLISNGHNLDVKELKELASTASSIISLSHRTESLLEEISTLRLFSQVVLEFIRSRSDSLGEDLLSELRAVSESMNASGVIPDA